MKKDFRYYTGKAWDKLKEWNADEVNKKPWIGIRGRQIVVLVLVMVLSCYVGFFLLKYTVLDGDRWRMLAGSQQMSTLTIKASRGSIYDANGTVLAQSSTVWDIIISPKAIYEANEEAKKQYEKDKERWALSKEEDRDPLKPYVELKEVISSGLAEILDADKEKLLKACENIGNEYYIVQRKVEKPQTTLINTFLAENEIRLTAIPLFKHIPS